MAAVAKSIRPSGSAIAEGLRCALRAVFDVSGAEKRSGWWLGEPFDRGRDLIRVRKSLRTTLRGGTLWPHGRFAFPEAFIWERSENPGDSRYLRSKSAMSIGRFFLDRAFFMILRRFMASCWDCGTSAFRYGSRSSTVNGLGCVTWASNACTSVGPSCTILTPA